MDKLIEKIEGYCCWYNLLARNNCWIHEGYLYYPGVGKLFDVKIINLVKNCVQCAPYKEKILDQELFDLVVLYHSNNHPDIKAFKGALEALTEEKEKQKFALEKGMQSLAFQRLKKLDIDITYMQIKLEHIQKGLESIKIKIEDEVVEQIKKELEDNKNL